MATEALTERVMQRIRAFQRDEMGPVLEPEALTEAAALLEASGEHGERSTHGLYAVAWLHWCRYLALPYDRRADDLRMAQRLFQPIASHDPGKVPPALRAEYGIDQDDDFSNRLAAMLDVLRKAVIAKNEEVLPIFIDSSLSLLSEVPATRAGVTDLWSMLAMAYRVRYQQTSSRDQLELMVDAARHAVASPNLPGHAAALDVLAIALKLRSNVTRDLADADEHISTLRRRIAQFPPADLGDARRKRLDQLADAFSDRFNRADQTPPVVNEDVVLLRDLVHQTPATSRLDRSSYLAVLGLLLRARYEETGEDTAIHESIDALRAAVNTATADEPRRPAYLAALAASLRLRHTSLGAPYDLDEAINALRAAAQPDPMQGRVIMATGLKAPPMPTLQYRLADALNTRAATLTDLDEALAVLGAALTVTPPGPRAKPDQASRGDMEHLYAVLARRRQYG